MRQVTELRGAARELWAARKRLAKALSEAGDAAALAHANGTPETVIARELGVNRMTVRRWLGKL